MKKIILLILLFIGAKNFAQTNGITYQAVILNPKGEQTPGVNNSNAFLVSKNICMKFEFMDEYSKLEYQEVIQTKTDEFGMVNLIIGSGSQTGGYASSFQDIVWNSINKKLIVAINTNGSCNSFTEISNQPFNSVPYAFFTKNAENVTGVVAIENGGTGAITMSGLKTNFGMEKMDNTSDLNKPISAAAQLAFSSKENVTNKSTSIAIDAASDTKYPTVKSVKTYVDSQVPTTGPQGIKGNTGATGAAGTNGAAGSKGDTGATGLTTSVNGVTQVNGAITITKTDINLGSVDNTSDADKPVSTLTQTALGLKVDKVTGERLINATEITKLDNQSGTNTGDQDLNGLATNTELALKAPLASPALTGTPVAPTAGTGTNTTQIATTAFVRSEVSAVSNSNGNFVTLNTSQQITGNKTFTRKIDLFAQSYANTATMNIGFAPNGENLSSIAMGINALYTHRYGTRQIGIGNEALYKDLRGSDNIGIGYRTLYNMTDTNNEWGNSNIAIGSLSGTNIIEGDNNTLIGTNSNTSTSVISNSSAIGYYAVVNANNTIQLGNTSITNVKTSGTLTAGTVTYPNVNGTTGQVLTTNGSGTASWAAAAGGGSFVDLTTAQTIAGVKTFSTDAKFNEITVGRGAGNSFYNTAVGYEALKVNTTGGTNTANGALALRNNTTGSENTAIGVNALHINTIGSNNTGIGSAALYYTSGRGNTAIGKDAMYENTTGSNNTAIGYNTGVSAGSGTGSGNTILGANVTGLATTLTNNIILANGTGAIKAQNDGTNWTMQGTVTAPTFIGALTGTATNVSGVVAVANGGTGATTKAAAFDALSPMTTAGDLIYGGTAGAGTRLGKGTNGHVLTLASGVPAWSAATGSGWSLTGNASTVDGTNFIGTTDDIPFTIKVNNQKAGRIETDSWSNNNRANTFLGHKAGNSNTTGGDNTANGNMALNSNTSGSQNTTSGVFALFSNSTGSGNVAIGVSSLNSNTTGSRNTANGGAALNSNTEGNFNTALGNNTGNGITTGSGNTILGAKVGAHPNTALAATLTNNIILASGDGVIKAQHDGTNWTMQGTVTAPTFIGALTGNATTATTATTATNLAAGSGGQIPYQSAAGTTAMLTNGTAGQVLQSNGTTLAPSWATAAGITLSAIGATANANGATITGTVLNLQPASASFGGIVTAGAQTIAGAKTFNADAIVNRITIGGGSVYNQNTIVGENALRVNTTGTNNTVMGMNSLFNNTTGASNTAIGMNSLYSNSTGNNITAIGTAALSSNTLGFNNSAFGSNALGGNTEGSYNTASGLFALLSNTTGSNNTASGNRALLNNTLGSYNTALGDNSGGGITMGSGNTILGARVGGLSATLTNNIILANGTGAIKAQHDGTDWTLTGGLTAGGITYPKVNGTTGQVLSTNGSGTATWETPASGGVPYTGATSAVNLGAYNLTVNGITVGLGAGLGASTNTAVGVSTLGTNTTGTSNTANGYQALLNNAEGGNNTANGRDALFFNGTGNANTANGANALINNTTGSDNTALGYKTGLGITTGSGNTILGAQVGAAPNTALAAGLTDNIILANGTGAIKAQHDGTNWAFTGAGVFSSSVTATSYITSSDLRYKDIISRTASSDGVDMIVYTWKKELNRDTLIHYGYVAQEVEKVYPDQVLTNAEGYKSVNYIEVLVAKNQALEKKNQELEKRMQALELLMKK